MRRYAAELLVQPLQSAQNLPVITIGRLVRVEIQNDHLHLPRCRRAQRGIHLPKRHVRRGEHSGKKPHLLEPIAAGEIGGHKSVLLVNGIRETWLETDPWQRNIPLNQADAEKRLRV